MFSYQIKTIWATNSQYWIFSTWNDAQRFYQTIFLFDTLWMFWRFRSCLQIINDETVVGKSESTWYVYFGNEIYIVAKANLQLQFCVIWFHRFFYLFCVCFGFTKPPLAVKQKQNNNFPFAFPKRFPNLHNLEFKTFDISPSQVFLNFYNPFFPKQNILFYHKLWNKVELIFKFRAF
jgi:hypothetical protein